MSTETDPPRQGKLDLPSELDTPSLTGLPPGAPLDHSPARLAVVRQLTALSRAVAHAASLETILQLAARQASSLLGADQTILMLVDDDGQARIRAAHGIDPAVAGQLEGVLDERLLARLDHTLTEGAARVFMAVPLIVQGAVTGLVAVTRSSAAAWTPTDEAVLAAVADQSAAPIEIARLSEEVRQARLVEDNVRLLEAERATRAELDAERARLGAVLENMAAGVILVEAPSGQVTFANSTAARLLGFPDGTPPSALEAVILGGGPEADDETDGTTEWPLGRALRTGDTITGEDVQYRRPDGTTATLNVNATAIRDPSGQVVAAVTTFSDVTQRRLVQQHLQRIQQMESVGRLAGGVAHEANNQMLVVLSASAFVLRHQDIPDDVRRDVEQIRRAAERTATVTSQLLAFSRRQVTQPEVLALDTVVADMAPVLRRALGDAGTLELRLRADRHRIRADKSQLEQVLINLTLNARDAMTEGTLTLTTRPATLDTNVPGAPPAVMIQPGRYVLLTCHDTGEGMDRETLQHAFEPFYTTKPVGQGTGLGLAFVYGAIKKSGGYVWVESEPGEGATFSVYLPMVEEVEGPVEASPSRARARPGEVVLVVDDEPAVLEMAARALREDGYEVLEAPDGPSSLRLLERDADRIRLLLTDVAMRELSGMELSARARRRLPGLPVVFMSGYPGDEDMLQTLEGSHSAFLLKPFSPEHLSECVRALLDGAQRGKARG